MKIVLRILIIVAVARGTGIRTDGPESVPVILGVESLKAKLGPTLGAEFDRFVYNYFQTNFGQGGIEYLRTFEINNAVMEKIKNFTKP